VNRWIDLAHDVFVLAGVVAFARPSRWWSGSLPEFLTHAGEFPDGSVSMVGFPQRV